MLCSNNITDSNISQEVLQNLALKTQSKTVKKILYKKAENARIINNMRSLGWDNKAKIILECGTYLELQIDNAGNEKVTASNFCRERMCQVCAWRRQLKFLATTVPALEAIAIDKKQECKYIFLTLTVKSVKGNYLYKTISDIMTAYDRFTKRRELKKYVLGTIRSLEVTYNAETETYHPHLHILMLMSETYFSNIINTAKFSAMWKESLRVNYSPIVYVETIKDKNGVSNTEEAKTKATLEVIKYAVKMKDVCISPETTRVISNALKSRRLIAFTGIINEYRKRMFGKDADLDTVNLLDEKTHNNAVVEMCLKFTPQGYEVINSHTYY